MPLAEKMSATGSAKGRPRDLRQVLEAVLEIVGEALGGGADSVDVHAVGAGAHDTAQATCAEFQILVESLDQLRLILGVKHAAHLLARLLVIIGSQPFLGTLHTLSQ